MVFNENWIFHISSRYVFDCIFVFLVVLGFQGCRHHLIIRASRSILHAAHTCFALRARGLLHFKIHWVFQILNRYDLFVLRGVLLEAPKVAETALWLALCAFFGRRTLLPTSETEAKTYIDEFWIRLKPLFFFFFLLFCCFASINLTPA